MNKEQVILGENCTYSTDCKETQLNNNILVCGSSGCGKSMSIAEPRLLQTVSSSLIITISKRRLVQKYTPLFHSRDYAVWDLNFVNPEASNVAYDPLQYIKSYADITFLAKSIVQNDPQKKNSKVDPYWNESACSLLSAEIAYVLMTKKHPCFSDVLDLHSSIEITESGKLIETNLDEKFEQIAQSDPNHFAVNCWRTFRQLPVNTASCIFSSLNVALDTIFTPELKKMMRKKVRVDFTKMANQKTLLFITTSAVNPSLNSFIAMFYSQAIKQLFEYAEKQLNGELPIPIHMLCDDFACGARINGFPEYISIFREKRISVTLLLQSESQLESMYGQEDATTIINNCDTYLYMGGMDLLTCRHISERLNQPLEDVMYMPLGQVMIFRRGQRPIVTKRYDIQKNALYQQITDAYMQTLQKKTLDEKT